MLFFKASCVELMKRMLVEESNHASVCEKLDDSATMRREYEMDRYHLALMKLLRDLQTQLSYLNEKLVPLHPQLRRLEDDARATWIYCQSVHTGRPLGRARERGHGRRPFQRNQQRAGQGADWAHTGRHRMGGEVDVRDPFETVYDPGYREDEEEEEEEREERRRVERERKREERQKETRRERRRTAASNEKTQPKSEIDKQR